VKPKSIAILTLMCSVFSLGLTSICPAQSANLSAVQVRIVTDEADAVLAILATKKAHKPISEADWQQLFASEGYIRLKKRETQIRQMYKDADPFDDAIFKSFVLSDDLAGRAQALAETLHKWKQADVTAAARRALAYLPKQSQIQAKIYPVIKPGQNSFVFEVKADPAIFLYLDPEVSKDKFENTLAHELHHIGYGSGCPSTNTAAEISKLPSNVQSAIEWIGAFGEGFAMLAAAGGPDVHPHAVSQPKERARWDRDMANYNEDLKKVEKFLLDVLENRLSKEAQEETSSAFFGIQGPWYTVGWKMAAIIEKRFGRAKLIECICDQRQLLSTYNRAAEEYNRSAREPLALWSAALVERINNIAKTAAAGGALRSRKST
jgi:Putative zinc dependent peptidase (DUF5700)